MKRQIKVPETRESYSYGYVGEEENNSSDLTAVAVQHRRREHQQEQEEQEIISDMKSFVQILTALNSLEGLLIFQRVASNSINGIDDTSLGRSVLAQITRKQYYLRMTALKRAGLISRTSGMYRLTSLGLVIRNSLRIIDKGIMFKWSLRAIDEAEARANHNLEPQIKDILIDKIVTDETIRKILIVEHGKLGSQL
jgi:hypothetical protein